MPRFRFTIRRMMIAVAIVAAILAVECQIVPWAVDFVSEGDGKGGRQFILGEAIMVWAVAHVAALLLLPIGASPLLMYLFQWNAAPRPSHPTPPPARPSPSERIV